MKLTLLSKRVPRILLREAMIEKVAKAYHKSGKQGAKGEFLNFWAVQTFPTKSPRMGESIYFSINKEENKQRMQQYSEVFFIVTFIRLRVYSIRFHQKNLNIPEKAVPTYFWESSSPVVVCCISENYS